MNGARSGPKDHLAGCTAVLTHYQSKWQVPALKLSKHLGASPYMRYGKQAQQPHWSGRSPFLAAGAKWPAHHSQQRNSCHAGRPALLGLPCSSGCLQFPGGGGQRLSLPCHLALGYDGSPEGVDAAVWHVVCLARIAAACGPGVAPSFSCSFSCAWHMPPSLPGRETGGTESSSS